MLIRLLDDLRFLIGAFFAIISGLLLLAGLIYPSEGTTHLNLNLLVSIYIGIFSIAMLGFSIWGNRKIYKKTKILSVAEYSSPTTLSTPSTGAERL